MASTSSQTPSSTPFKWDVFLSFRGKDTRTGFTSHLYSALDRYNIKTFIDSSKLRCGEGISDALLQAIQESKIYIVILSENYASSRWCLDELVEILNCKRLVIPVFYKIDPAVVRYQKGSFEKHFKDHETRYHPERVKNWRLKLGEVAGKSGKRVGGEKSEADIVDEILDEILFQIKPTALPVARYPVGLDSRVQYITELLSRNTEGVTMIGLYGMGGVGKTTLAKAVFNKLLLEGFKESCFLENVRETSTTSEGLMSLQQKLIKNVLKIKNKDEFISGDQGAQMIEAGICSTKILVVIDDLDDYKGFKSIVGPFASGSVVIITTRNEEILDRIGVGTRYSVEKLGEVDSETLFIRHAFQDTKPDNTLMLFSKAILRLAGGLPLALQVFGSYLFGRSEFWWKIYIERLQQVPDDDIQKRLIISLDALESDDPQLKKMFLDIACFFIGRKKKKVVQILDTYYRYADDIIDILKKRCLLTINDSDELQMHDLLHDMGKYIAHNNSPHEPGKHSRLWVPKDIFNVLKAHKGTNAIEVIMPITPHSYIYDDDWPYGWPYGLIFDDDSKPKNRCEASFAMETLSRMSKLRFLYLEGINLTGNCNCALEDLRWFRWFRCPLKCLPFDFCPEKLVILELPFSKLTKMWKVNKGSKVFEKLKTLKMSHSKYLTTTPDFIRLPCLEKLYFCGCTSLKEVHISIGSLVSLFFLNLNGCVNLRSLPDTICKLEALEVLCIEDCTSLEALPIQLGNIKFLKELNAKNLTVPNLPDSIGGLSKLVKLDLSYNLDLESLPNTICDLRALEVLCIEGCTNLEALPIQLGNIKSLKELNAKNLTVPKLPDSIGGISKLVKLDLGYNHDLESLPNTICDLRALEVLRISWCSSLKALPVDLGNIESLRELRAEGINVSILPDSICNMRSLEILEIEHCDELESLPDQLWKLTRLLNLETLLPLMKAPNHIEPSHIYTELNLSWSNIRALPSGISQLSNLKDLRLVNCPHLLSIAELPPKLTNIDASYCTSLKIVNLSNLKMLTRLDLTDCSALTEILGLEELASLDLMFLEGCQSSLLSRTLTKRLFQIYSGFEQIIGIGIWPKQEEILDWIIQSSVEWSIVKLESYSCLGEEIPTRSNLSGYLNLQPNLSHNYLGMVLRFERCIDEWSYIFSPLEFSIMTSASNTLLYRQCTTVVLPRIVVLPRSLFRVRDTYHKIKVSSNASIVWIHLLYKNEDDSTTVKVEDERNTPSISKLEVEDGSSTTVNVEDERNTPSSMEVEDGSSTTVNVEDERNTPSSSDLEVEHGSNTTVNVEDETNVGPFLFGSPMDILVESNMKKRRDKSIFSFDCCFLCGYREELL